jgi:pimeloyl-ACP methyl ester carboxylesterase
MAEIMVNGEAIHLLESRAANPANRWPILFIHGSGGNSGIWRKLMQGLSSEYTCLAVDLPGHGQSHGEGKKSIQEYTGFLVDFMKAMGLKRVVLGGHSMGGGIAQDFSLRFPEKVGALLLIGTGARLRVLPEVLELMRKMASGEIPPKFEPWGFAGKTPPEIIAEGENEWAKTGGRARYQDFLACDQFDVMGEVEKILQPTLIVCGREDRLTPVKYSEFLQKKIAGSRMEVIGGAGHMVMLEAPKALSEAIGNFLRSCVSD